VWKWEITKTLPGVRSQLLDVALIQSADMLAYLVFYRYTHTHKTNFMQPNFSKNAVPFPTNFLKIKGCCVFLQAALHNNMLVFHNASTLKPGDEMYEAKFS
jgi:hypothetical protein